MTHFKKITLTALTLSLLGLSACSHWSQPPDARQPSSWSPQASQDEWNYSPHLYPRFRPF